LAYLQKFANDQYKRNPYYLILKEAGYRWSGKSLNILNKMQPFLPLGFSKGILNGIYFSNSDETSLSGSLRSGNLNAQIIRLELNNKIKLN